MTDRTSIITHIEAKAERYRARGGIVARTVARALDALASDIRAGLDCDKED